MRVKFTFSTNDGYTQILFSCYIKDLSSYNEVLNKYEASEKEHIEKILDNIEQYEIANKKIDDKKFMRFLFQYHEGNTRVQYNRSKFTTLHFERV